MLRSLQFKSGVHFFIDDYRFERLWTSSEKYLTKLQKFSCTFAPDFNFENIPVKYYHNEHIDKLHFLNKQRKII